MLLPVQDRGKGTALAGVLPPSSCSWAPDQAACASSLKGVAGRGGDQPFLLLLSGNCRTCGSWRVGRHRDPRGRDENLAAERGADRGFWPKPPPGPRAHSSPGASLSSCLAVLGCDGNRSFSYAQGEGL